MLQYKNIYYPTLLHESLRDFFSVNKSADLSYLYKFLLCVLMPLQIEWNLFEIYRKKIWLISQCRWLIGQLTNLLNYLYDPSQNRICISQSVVGYIFESSVDDETTLIFDPVIAETPVNFDPTLIDVPSSYPMKIYIPSSLNSDSVNYADMISTLEKIRPCGLKYNIIEVITS